MNVSSKSPRLLMDLNQFKEQKIIHSAVMVLHEKRTDDLILTQRSEHLRAHPGEICFPGGIWEEGDDDYYCTALRELYEELGINSDRVSCIKKLNTQKTLLGRIIHPWFASIESIHPYQLNTEEVTRLITIPLSLAQDIHNYKDFVIERDGKQYVTCEFTANKERVWGATAHIMKQLSK